MQKWFGEQKVAQDFVGKVGERHRVFVFSADTFGLESAEPWTHTRPCKDTELAVVMEWMGRQNGPTDVLLSFDGRNVTDRKAMSTAFDPFRHSCDLWVVYKPSQRTGRSVAWASDREIGFLSLPVPRRAIATKEHTRTASEWAPSTHASFYQGVPQVPWGALPVLSKQDKSQVLGVDPGSITDPPSSMWDAARGTPLYWSERKPVALWEDLLFCLDANMVVDLSPGSGSVGRAALRLGIQYVAVCRTDAHASWLGNVLDREACELIVKDTSPLFEQDLSTLIKKHFAYILDAQQREAEDGEAEADGGEELL